MNTEYYNLWRKCKIHTKQEQICDRYESQNHQYSNVLSHVPMREFVTNRSNISSHPAKLVSASLEANKTKTHLLWQMYLFSKTSQTSLFNLKDQIYSAREKKKGAITILLFKKSFQAAVHLLENIVIYYLWQIIHSHRDLYYMHIIYLSLEDEDLAAYN